MAKSSRRYKPLHQSNGDDSVRMPRSRALLQCFAAVVVLAVVLGVYLSTDSGSGHVNRTPVADLTKDRVRELCKENSTQVRELVCCGA